jgi:hypothetical protein
MTLKNKILLGLAALGPLIAGLEIIWPTKQDEVYINSSRGETFEVVREHSLLGLKKDYHFINFNEGEDKYTVRMSTDNGDRLYFSDEHLNGAWRFFSVDSSHRGGPI